MKISSKNVGAACFAALLLSACATSNDKADSTESGKKFQKSSFCKGAIDKANALQQALEVLQGDPVRFACNAAYKYSLALVKTYAAIGNVEKERDARETSERLLNGTADPKDVKVIAIVDSTTEQKAKESELLAGVNEAERRKLFEEASAERQKAMQELVKGTAAVYFAVNQIKQDANSDDPMMKMRAGLKFVQVLAAAQVIPVLFDTEKQMRTNLKHLEVYAKTDNVDLSAPPPPPGK